MSDVVMLPAMYIKQYDLYIKHTQNCVSSIKTYEVPIGMGAITCNYKRLCTSHSNARSTPEDISYSVHPVDVIPTTPLHNQLNQPSTQPAVYQPKSQVHLKFAIDNTQHSHEANAQAQCVEQKAIT
ncbi:hypothetical protein M8J77_016263 [Diaphorina citri]|nr:hypothetical protein M8J77_016263 [Diaphorina citri]